MWAPGCTWRLCDRLVRISEGNPKIASCCTGSGHQNAFSIVSIRDRMRSNVVLSCGRHFPHRVYSCCERGVC
jgi:hypothetical protein